MRIGIRYELISIFAVLLFLASCVPSRQFDELKAKHQQCDLENARLKQDNLTLSTRSTELSAEMKELERLKKALENDTASLSTSLRRTNSLYKELGQTYEKLIEQNEKLLAGNSEETKKLISKLHITQENLQKKEDELKRLSRDLTEKEKVLNEANSKLKEREIRLQELETILNKKDSTVNALKTKVSEALLGFQDKGLSVELKNGKVYVSLEERLLFASGSIVVDPKGVDALKQLAKVLEKNPDINVMVEGHTDNVPISGVIKDNWDLSVLRSTAVIKILTSNSSIDPSRLIAAGRGQYSPIDSNKTAETRKRNRRTEIILTPKLDELLKVLEVN